MISTATGSAGQSRAGRLRDGQTITAAPNLTPARPGPRRLAGMRAARYGQVSGHSKTTMVRSPAGPQARVTGWLSSGSTSRSATTTRHRLSRPDRGVRRRQRDRRCSEDCEHDVPQGEDILRAAQLALLTESNPRVRVTSPRSGPGRSFHRSSWYAATFTSPRRWIADGYHRVCAGYLTDENTPIPCRLVSWQLGDALRCRIRIRHPGTAGVIGTAAATGCGARLGIPVVVGELVAGIVGGTGFGIVDASDPVHSAGQHRLRVGDVRSRHRTRARLHVRGRYRSSAADRARRRRGSRPRRRPCGRISPGTPPCTRCSWHRRRPRWPCRSSTRWAEGPPVCRSWPRSPSPMRPVSCCCPWLLPATCSDRRARRTASRHARGCCSWCFEPGIGPACASACTSTPRSTGSPSSCASASSPCSACRRSRSRRTCRSCWRDSRSASWLR